jgi:S-adenosylmethionine:tRNA ribosyltransferase-isomerase
MNKLERILARYDYQTPKQLIAQKPAAPRDAARLLVYDRRDKKVRFNTFKNLGKYLPKNSVLVFNKTKVWPARLIVVKPTGGKVELLYISHDKNFIKVLANKKLPIGSKESFFLGREKSSPITFTVTNKIGQFYFLKPSFPLSQIPKILRHYGITPLPPYIKNSPLTEIQRRKEYQSIFAKTGLSVAAPTASLHFTKRLIKNLRRRGIEIKFVQLDVGLGTFAPLRGDNIKTGKLHREFYKIDKSTAKFLTLAKKQGRPIIAVGTTVVRTLESAAQNLRLTKLSGDTELFIRENYKFKFVDGIITNFHVPKSSLMMLVSAFLGKKTLLNLYQKALKKKFRFFSFGDGMLIV